MPKRLKIQNSYDPPSDRCALVHAHFEIDEQDNLISNSYHQRGYSYLYLILKWPRLCKKSVYAKALNFPKICPHFSKIRVLLHF